MRLRATAPLACLLYALAGGLVTSGCGNSRRAENAQRAGTYGAELDACIVEHDTQEAAQRCWCDVARRWTRPCPSIEGDAGL